MGLFLHGKWITAGVVFVAFAVAVFMFSYYIWILAHHVAFPTVLTEVVAVFSMLFWFAWGVQSLATCHSIHQKSKALSFGRWAIMGIVTISFDMLYFGMMINYSGFQAGSICNSNTKRDGSSSMCSHRAAAIGLAVAIFITAVFRLFCLLVVWHWDVRWNQTPAATNNAPTPATPAPDATKTKVQSLPKRRRRRPKPSIDLSDHDEEVQLFPAASSPLRAHDFDFSDSDSDSDSFDSASHSSSSEEVHLNRKSRDRL